MRRVKRFVVVTMSGNEVGQLWGTVRRVAWRWRWQAAIDAWFERNLWEHTYQGHIQFRVHIVEHRWMPYGD